MSSGVLAVVFESRFGPSRSKSGCGNGCRSSGDGPMRALGANPDVPRGDFCMLHSETISSSTVLFMRRVDRTHRASRRQMGTISPRMQFDPVLLGSSRTIPRGGSSHRTARGVAGRRAHGGAHPSHFDPTANRGADIRRRADGHDGHRQEGPAARTRRMSADRDRGRRVQLFGRPGDTRGGRSSGSRARRGGPSAARSGGPIGRGPCSWPGSAPAR